MAIRPRLTALTILSLSTGCLGSGEPSEFPQFGNTDSDKIVVSSGEGAWAAGGAWAVEEVLAVGGLDAGAEGQFGEISGVDVDRAGNIYVADKQAQNVRVFDATGRYLRTIGQPGEGPGEFGPNIGGVFLIGDEIVVPDASLSRVSHFGLDGDFVASERISMGQGIPIRWDVTHGSLIAQRRLMVPGDRTAAAGDAVVTLGMDPQSVDTVATLPGGQSVQITGGLPKIVQFEPEPVWDADVDGRLAVAMTSEWRLEVRDAAGEVEWIAVRPSNQVRVTERHREAVRTSLREMYRGQGVPRQVSEEVISRMEFAEHLPALAAVAFGPFDSLWVQGFTPPDEFEDTRVRFSVQDMGSLDWGVFDAEGQYLGVVRFPVDFHPVRVVEDRFYGIARDELDVPTVRVFRVLTD